LDYEDRLGRRVENVCLLNVNCGRGRSIKLTLRLGATNWD